MPCLSGIARGVLFFCGLESVKDAFSITNKKAHPEG